MTRSTGKLEDHKLVAFTIRDAENLKNWSKGYRWYGTMVVTYTCFVAFASGVVTAHLTGVSERFNVSNEVSLLTITVFITGFGVGGFSKHIFCRMHCFRVRLLR